MHFIQLNIRCNTEMAEILVAELAELEFDSFEENKSGFSAYVPETKIDFDETKELLERYAATTPISYSFQKVDRENWNQNWESNYQPIVVQDQILIRAPFHDIKDSFPVCITIIPKMSFGTGHHATTSQMLAFLLQYRPENQYVIDAGTGTGILAIMAEKMGASRVVAFDNDAWCIENSEENFLLNQTRKCRVLMAQTIAALPEEEHAGTLLANINKNVLLAEIPLYARYLVSGGRLFLSGFYTEDITDLQQLAQLHHLRLIDQSAHDNWACLVLQKN